MNETVANLEAGGEIEFPTLHSETRDIKDSKNPISWFLKWIEEMVSVG